MMVPPCEPQSYLRPMVQPVGQYGNERRTYLSFCDARPSNPAANSYQCGSGATSVLCTTHAQHIFRSHADAFTSCKLETQVSGTTVFKTATKRLQKLQNIRMVRCLFQQWLRSKAIQRPQSIGTVSAVGKHWCTRTICIEIKPAFG